MELLVIGFLLGCLITLGVSRLRENTYERVRDEFQSDFDTIELKHSNINLQLDQIKEILKDSSLTDLLIAKNKLDTLAEEFIFEKQTSRENFQRLFSEVYRIKGDMKYIPKNENTYN